MAVAVLPRRERRDFTVRRRSLETSSLWRRALNNLSHFFWVNKENENAQHWSEGSGE